MKLIEWRDEFLLGMPNVDHEHRQLIELINELYENYLKGGSKSAVMDFLGEIYVKITAHFALEEKIMRELIYDQYTDHKTDHETSSTHVSCHHCHHGVYLTSAPLVLTNSENRPLIYIFHPEESQDFSPLFFRPPVFA